MSNKFRRSMYTLLAGVLFLAAARPAAAETITYTETIADSSYATLFDLFDLTRDLTRTRTFGDGSIQVETDDATIISENALSDTWGFSTFFPMVWTHIFPLDPSATTFLHASLTLDVIGVDSGLPDIVFVDFFPVGALTPGATDVQSTTYLSTDGLADPNSAIAFFLADGQLNVIILPLILDFMTIRSSTLEVTYDADPVPEPTTAVLLMSGLAIAEGRRRRHRSRSACTATKVLS
jgi:hypothetical protein